MHLPDAPNPAVPLPLGCDLWDPHPNRILMYENGVVAINLPISRQLLGANSTRTAHPQTLRRFSQVLSAVAEKPFAVENPFALKTRKEVIERIAECGAAHLIVTAHPR